MEDLLQLQPCILCSGKTERRLTDLTFEADDITIIITGVPVAVCLECGEEYVPGPLAVLISDKVAEFAERMRLVNDDKHLFEEISFKASLSQSGIALGDQSPIWAIA